MLFNGAHPLQLFFLLFNPILPLCRFYRIVVDILFLFGFLFLSEGRRPIIAEDVASLSLSLSFSFCCWISLDYIIFFLSEKTLFPLSSLIYISSCRPLSTPPTPLLLHIKKSRAKWPDRQLLESAQMECRSATVIDVQSKSRPLRLRDMISMDIGDFKLQSKMFLMYIKTFPSSSLSVLFLYRIWWQHVLYNSVITCVCTVRFSLLLSFLFSLSFSSCDAPNFVARGFSQRWRSLRVEIEHESHCPPQRPSGVAAAGHLQVRLWHWRWIFPIGHTDLFSKTRELDICWVPGPHIFVVVVVVAHSVSNFCSSFLFCFVFFLLFQFPFIPFHEFLYHFVLWRNKRTQKTNLLSLPRSGATDPCNFSSSSFLCLSLLATILSLLFFFWLLLENGHRMGCLQGDRKWGLSADYWCHGQRQSPEEEETSLVLGNDLSACQLGFQSEGDGNLTRHRPALLYYTASNRCTLSILFFLSFFSTKGAKLSND